MSGRGAGRGAPLSATIIETVRHYPGINTGAIVKIAGSRYATVQAALDALERQGHIQRTHAPRGGTHWWVRGAPRARLCNLHEAPLFAHELRQLLNHRLLPGGLRGELRAPIEGGRLAPLTLVRYSDDVDGGWPADTFLRDVRLWIQRRTPADWWGAVTVKIERGKAVLVTVSRSFK